MKCIRKFAKFVGYTIFHGEKFAEWRCPSCGFGVSEDYVCCPYCGRKIKFGKIPETKLIDIWIMRSDTN